MIFIKKNNKNPKGIIDNKLLREKFYDVNTAVTKMIHFNLILQQ